MKVFDLDTLGSKATLQSVQLMDLKGQLDVGDSTHLFNYLKPETIVALWAPKTPLEPGKEFSFGYKLIAMLDSSDLHPGGRVVNTYQAVALPPLNPNQPTHSIAAPIKEITTLCGGIGTLPYPRRRPRNRAQTSAETPELMCTTVPPAKSSAPRLCSQPPIPHTQWASGS